MIIVCTSPYYNEALWRRLGKQNYFSINFPKKFLRAALKNYSNWGIDILIPRYFQTLEQLKQEDTFCSKVKMAILNLANPNLPSIESVAEVYHYSVRTFQRRLNAEGFSYRDIIDETKKEISALLIMHDRFQIADIAAILGYAESSPLIRSFKKWHGMSPRQYMLKMGQAD